MILRTDSNIRFRFLSEAPAVAIAVLGGLLTALVLSTRLDSHHMGLMFKTAVDLSHGAVPYRETQVIYGVLTSWIQAGVVILFQGSVLGMGIATAVVFAVMLLGLYLLWRQFLTPLQATIPLAMYFAVLSYAQSPWANYYAQAFALLSAVAAARWRHTGRPVLLFLSGFLVALTYLSRHQSGPFLAIAIALFVSFVSIREERALRPPMRNLAVFFCGIFAVLLPFFAGLAYVDALADWYIQTQRSVSVYFWERFGLPSTFSGAIRSAIHILMRRPWGPLGLAMAGFACFAATAQALALRRQARYGEPLYTPQGDNAVLAALVAVAMWPMAFPSGDEHRFALALSPSFGTLAWLAVRFGPARVPALLRVAVLLLLMLPVFYSKAGQLAPIFRLVASYVRAPCAQGVVIRDIPRLNRMCLDLEIAEYYRILHRSISDYETEHPGVNLVTFMGDPMPLTFVSRPRSAHPISIVWAAIKWHTQPNHYPETDGDPTDSLMRLDDTANVRMYPDYWSVIRSYIERHRPLILSPYERYPGYRVRRRLRLPRLLDYYYHRHFYFGKFKRDDIYLLEPERNAK